eukprot:9445719-Lingulodinium_polyedra.AAC.1
MDLNPRCVRTRARADRARVRARRARAAHVARAWCARVVAAEFGIRHPIQSKICSTNTPTSARLRENGSGVLTVVLRC